VNSSNALTCVAAECVLIAAVLSGCSAGQQAQTATMKPDVNGNMADVNDVALRNIRIRAEQTGYAVRPGTSVDLALVATNSSPVTADSLVAITSGIGEVNLVGNTSIPAEGVLIVDSPDRAHAGAATVGVPVSADTEEPAASQPAGARLN
jgi:hypothetical protein